MEQADFFKMTMSVAEAKKIVEQLPEDCIARHTPEHVVNPAIYYGLNLMQIQALLVLSWEKVLNMSKLSYDALRSEDKETGNDEPDYVCGSTDRDEAKMRNANPVSIKDFYTCQLCDELARREGVELTEVPPYESKWIRAEGPAIVFNVID